MIARLRADARALPVLALIVAIFGFTAARNATYAQAGTYAAIYAIAAIGLSLLLGNVKQISIGQAGFFGIGAYAVAYLTSTLNWPFWPAAIIGVLAATLVGFGVGFVALRFRGHYLAMATLSFGLIVVGLLHESKLLGGASGISSIPYASIGSLSLSGYTAYWFVWAVALLAALLTLNLLRGRTGRAFETIRNDELAAEVVGVATQRYKILAFAYAGALAGLSGAIYAAFLGLIVPDAVGAALSIDFLLMVVLGGQGGVSGALIGAALIGFLDISGHAYENWREVAYGALVIIVVIAAPGGVIGLFRRTKREARAALSVTTLPVVAAPVRPPNGDAPLVVRDVTKRFGGLTAVDAVNFTLERGSLTSLIGPNGAGKTTLFRMITGQEHPDGGALRVGDTVKLGYVDQSRDSLDAAKSVWEEISGGTDVIYLGKRAVPSRAYVGAFNFKGSDQQKKVGILSGGERNRVHLAKMLKSESNVILLDEPTNDLDIDTLRALEEALAEFAGCVVVISHDRWFLDRLATHILAFEGDSHVEWFEGNFQAYEADKRRRLGNDATEPHRIKYRPLAR